MNNASRSPFPAFLSTFADPGILRNHGTTACTAMTGTKVLQRRQHPPRPILHYSRPSMSTSMPEIPEVNLPEPALPKKGDIDPDLGSATGVITVDAVEADVETTWLESILSSRDTLPTDHPLSPLRIASETRIPDLPLPNRKQESWRFTSLTSLYASRYYNVFNQNEEEDIRALIDLDRIVSSNHTGPVVVLVDGKIRSEFTHIPQDMKEKGLFIGSISEYTGDVASLRELWTTAELGDDAELGAGLFPAVGNAIAADAVVIDIPAGVRLDNFDSESESESNGNGNGSLSRPIVIVSVSTNGPSAILASASAPRIAIIAHPDSSATIYEYHSSPSGSSSSPSPMSAVASNGNGTEQSTQTALKDKFGRGGGLATVLSGTVTKVSDKANVKHIYTNSTNERTNVISAIRAVVETEGSYDFRVACMGGNIGRVSVGIDLEGESSRASMRGVILTDGYRTQDIHSRVTHNNEGTTCEQLQKNVATDHGRAVFCGRIIVTDQCLKTDSNQLSKSLVISETASVDAMPILEIANDDVTCTHGATVSDLRDDELFYFRSRGLSHRQAQAALVLGFASEVFRDCLHETLHRLVADKIAYVSDMSKERSKEGAVYSSV